MVHNLPENFNISDFDVFHSALTSTQDAIFNPELKKRFQVEPSEPTDEVVCPGWQAACLILQMGAF